jgi:predicted O-linked N-acetylglucosamine transferase (SPINDLY family)
MVLYPYSPDWNVEYDHERFENALSEMFESEGVSKLRLRILGALSGKAKIRALLRLVDIYLDGFPYAGANSMVDALLTDTPPVALGGKTMRERMGAALMMEVGLDPLVAGDEAAYERIAIRLASDPAERQYWRERITAGMAGSPRFLDPHAYCAHFASVLEEVTAPTMREVTHA